MSDSKSHGKLLSSRTKNPAVLLTAAAVLLALGLVACNYFIQSLNFHRQVFSKKNAVETQLEENEKTLSQLEGAYLNLERQGPTSDEVLSVLPSSKDFPNTSASLESIILRSGMQLQTISVGGDDDAEAVTQDSYATSNPSVEEMQLSVEVQGSYSSLRDLLENLENSRRVFVVQGIDVSGSNERLSATLDITSYYQQAVDNNIDTEEFSL